MHNGASITPSLSTRLAATAKRFRSRGLSLGATLRSSSGGLGPVGAGGNDSSRVCSAGRRWRPAEMVAAMAAVGGTLLLLTALQLTFGNQRAAAVAAAGRGGRGGGALVDGAARAFARPPPGAPTDPQAPPGDVRGLPPLRLPPPRCGNVFVYLHDGDGRGGSTFFRAYGANDSRDDALVRVSRPRRIGACVHVFEGAARHDGALLALAAAPTPRWRTRSGKARRLFVYPRAVLAAAGGGVRRVPGGASAGASAGESSPYEVREVDAGRFLLAATYPRAALDAGDGVVAVRLRVTGGAAADAAGQGGAATLRALYGSGGGSGGASRSVLCQRVDYVLVAVGVAGVSEAEVGALAELASAINADAACRTHVTLTGASRPVPGAPTLALPTPPGQHRSVFYAVLAGPPTFRSRVGAATATWARGAPRDRLTFYTTPALAAADRAVAGGLPVVLGHPSPPAPGAPGEQWPERMQSWSHLVRLRLAWDGGMRDDPTIRWLALVDDDTFVYTDAAAAALGAWNDKLPLWGGSGEIVRVDNGDAGTLAMRLRATHLASGGEPCALPSEPEYERARAHGGLWAAAAAAAAARGGGGGGGGGAPPPPPKRCSDTFCKGCASIPQGGTVFLSRALVSALRPSVEACEAATRNLCARCGSQRLYACVTGAVGGARSAMLRGVHRSPWRREAKERAVPVVSFHGFEHARGRYTASGTLGGDFARLWALRRPVEAGGVTVGDVADDIKCRRGGHWDGAACRG